MTSEVAVHLIIACALILLGAIAATFFSLQRVAHGLRHHPKCIQLWVYTFPVQKGPCVVFKHPSGHELEKADRANIEFNRGVEAGHLKKSTCPSGNSKEFCAGWQSATQFTLQQLMPRQHDNNNDTLVQGK
jgi:hypothetical protein